MAEPTIDRRGEGWRNRALVGPFRLGFFGRQQHPPVAVDFLEMPVDLQECIVAQPHRAHGQQGDHQPIAIEPGAAEVGR